MSNAVTTQPTIEFAAAADIEAAAHIYQAAAEDFSDQLRARNPWTNLAARSEDFEQAVRTLSTLRDGNDRAVIVARDQGRVVGMAAVQIQLPHAHVAFFFVHPEFQNRGIGRRLLDQVQAGIDEAGASVVTLASSRDPKAWQRYLRFGLHPGPPQLPFRANSPAFPEDAPVRDDIDVRPLAIAGVPLIAGLDRDVRGADRRDRLMAWLENGATGAVATDRASGEVVGYALASMGPHNGQIGPVAAATPETFPFMLDLALHLAGTVANPQRQPWRVDCSARNSVAIAQLLEAGFSLENLVNWFESAPVGKWDRYIFRDEDEL